MPITIAIPKETKSGISIKLPVINSTEGGILVEIPRMPLKQSLETYCIHTIEKSDTFELKKRKRRKKK